MEVSNHDLQEYLNDGFSISLVGFDDHAFRFESYSG